MYQSPIPVNKNKQCSECKNYDYDCGWDMSNCLAGYGWGEHSTVESSGTCENWEKRIQ